MTTLQQMTDSVFDILLKQPTQSGVITEARIKNILNDVLDFYVSKSSSFTGSFFLKEVEITGTANNREITIPTDCAIIQNIKYKSSSDTWTPLNYHEINDVPEGTDVSHISGNSYYFMNNKLIIYPTPSQAFYIKIQYTAFPASLSLSADPISSEFNKCLLNAIKWRTAYVCWTLLNDTNAIPPWQSTFMEWDAMAMKHLGKRKADFGVVQNFTDY